MNSPVQIILNTDDFIKALDRPRGGSSKDFFAWNDKEFVAHRSNIQQQLHDIKEMQIVSSYATISYAKVLLNKDALAKSHRPTAALFRPDIAPVVGAGELGELYVELTPGSIDELNIKVGKAEIQTKFKEEDGVKKPKPSKIRSEIGAIDKISPITSEDKIRFSVSEALSWLSNSQTGGAYMIELFEVPPARQDWDTLYEEKLALFESFVKGLESLGNEIVFSPIVRNASDDVIFGIRIEEGRLLPSIQFVPSSSSFNRNMKEASIKMDSGIHQELLMFLGEHPLVKKVSLPAIVKHSSGDSNIKRGEMFDIPKLDQNISYPKLCVVDGGVSDIFDDWIEDRWGLISPSDKDENHGTFIAGLSVFGQTLNGSAICKEIDGCKIIDLDILPKDDKYSTYYTRPLEFFNELDVAVNELVVRTGVRIFNFSLNIEEHVSADGYSLPAQILDRIAEDNDVIFIISAGNTHPRDMRKEWPSDHFKALKILASSRNDTIKKPAESSRNISVSALNPPHVEDVVPYALSNYSCRGPGLRGGLKPDLAHVGGAGTKHPSLGHGLLSLDVQQNVIDGCGTSYATPNVAKTMAAVEHSIEGKVSRETLIALGVHNSRLPSSLNDKGLKGISKHLVGFGIPKSSDEILNGDSSAITLVFANRAIHGRKLSFRFSWPNTLVKNGKCIGHARLTIVSTPPLDYRFGSEFVRVNIDASLRQLQADGKFKGRLEPVHTPEDATLYEKDQINHLFKWSPVKVFEKSFPRGVGPTTDWALEVEYPTRDGVAIPRTGVPFTAILTISDPNRKEPVFNDMRQMLQTLGVNAVDIRTAARIAPRV